MQSFANITLSTAASDLQETGMRDMNPESAVTEPTSTEAAAPVTDVHAHVIVPEIRRDAAPGESWRPSVHLDQDGRQVVEIDGREVRSMVHELSDVDAILESRAASGVSRVVLSPVVPLLYPNVEAEVALERCRIQNDGIARMVHGAPGRVVGLGAVPLQDPELAATELRRIMAAGELRGVEVGASVRDVYLGDDRFEPFWAAASETGAVVFIHPTTRGFGGAVFGEYYLWNLVGNPLETTITAAHLILSGMLERQPDSKVVLAHGGGALLALRGRLKHGHGFQPEAGARLREAPYEAIRRFYFDTAVHDPELVRSLVDFAGPEHVLLGSDYPFDMADPHPAETVRRADLDPDAEAAVLGGNAARLFGLA
jgi:aminocarboxymuconate-semialdehyde decarboxylase